MSRRRQGRGAGDPAHTGGTEHPDDGSTEHPDDAVDHSDDALGLYPQQGTGHGTDDGHEKDALDLEALRAALRRSAQQGSVPSTERRPVTRTSRRDQQRQVVEHRRRRARRRRRSVIVAIAVLAVIAGGVTVLVLQWRAPKVQEIRDFVGSGDTQVVVHVEQGDALSDIANTLAQAQVVASAVAFVDVGSGDEDIAALQPGYFRLKMHSSASSAADQLADAANRVGRLRVIPGLRLSDVTSTNGTVVPGYLSQLAQAACVPLNGQSNCATVQQLVQVATSTPAAQLGIVDWAQPEIARQPAGVNRLEGMLLPGDYDVPPGADAATLLTSVFTAAAVRWNASDVIANAESEKISPYQAVIIASVVERESNTADMPQVARVVFNRIKAKMRWQMDSTVNYALDRAQISVTLTDLKVDSPYNTYRVVGTPPTPISSPGDDALDATFEPIPGDWLYFVKVDQQGNSCFSVTMQQHEACIKKARAAGVLGG